MFQLGRHGTIKGNIIAPIASRSALVLSSTNDGVLQPPGLRRWMFEQAFSPHYPHTERRPLTNLADYRCRAERQQCHHGATLPAAILPSTSSATVLGW
jgi:hypothetical protein